MLLYETGIIGKWLAMLKEVAPRVTRAQLSWGTQRQPLFIISSVRQKPQRPRSLSNLCQLPSRTLAAFLECHLQSRHGLEHLVALLHHGVRSISGSFSTKLAWR